MRYVDGFVVPVKKNKIKEYRKIAQKWSKICREHGALEYVEAVADNVKPGKWTSFPQSVKLKPNEIVVLGYVVYKSRTHRDRAWEKIMSDPRTKNMHHQMRDILDGRRMFWGGFKMIVEA